MTEKRKRCKTCECYDCDCEECSCNCHHNDRVLADIHDRQSNSQSDTEIQGH